MRVINRKFGRDGSSPYATGASHVIKIGFDKRKAGATHPSPGKFPGFVICRDSLDGQGNLVVDHAAMQMLGIQYTAEAIEKAKKGELKAPEGLLPTVLHFVIMQSAVRLGDQWSFPGTVNEAYECWTKEGKYCSGDGERAKRKQGNGAQAEIDCVPVGRAGADPAAFCQYSANKTCRSHSRLVLCLFEPNEKGEPEPLSDSLGFTARFRFDTTSEYGAMGFFEALDRAADRVQGYLLRLTGTLSYSIKRRRTGDANFSTGIVGSVLLAIDEDSICQREAEIREYGEKMRRLRIEERKALALPAPEEPIDEAEEVPKPTLVVEPDPEPDPEPEPEAAPAREPWKIRWPVLANQIVSSQLPSWPWQWRTIEGDIKRIGTEAHLRQIQDQDQANHKRLVKRALKEGKPVPAEVLADYPDLAPAAPEAEAAPAEEPEFEPADLETEASEPEIDLCVAQADDYTLADSLSAFADDKFSAYAWFDYESDGKTERFAAPNEDWFFNQPEGSRKDLFRRAKLREICLRLEASEPGFAVLAPTERSVAP